MQQNTFGSIAQSDNFASEYPEFFVDCSTKDLYRGVIW